WFSACVWFRRRRRSARRLAPPPQPRRRRTPARERGPNEPRRLPGAGRAAPSGTRGTSGAKPRSATTGSRWLPSLRSTRPSGLGGAGVVEQGGELVEVHGLDQVMVETGLAGAEDRVLLAVAGDGDDERAGMLVFTECLGDLVAAHARQADVEEDDVGLRRVG